MKKRLVGLVLVTLTVGAPAAWADGILPYGGGTTTWSSWGTGDLAPASYGSHFWNNSSNDLGECNVGYWISGTPGCLATGAEFSYHYGFYDLTPQGLTTLPPYFGDGNDPFYFEPTGNDAVTVTMDLQLAKWARTGDNSLGWYELDGTAGGLLFGAGTVLGQQVTFSPDSAYGFYLTSPRGTFTTTGLYPFGPVRPDPLGRSHFAAFVLDPLTGTYVLGVEDNVYLEGGDYDYNDLVFGVRSASVPEPGTLMLMALGLGGFAAARRRQKK